MTALHHLATASPYLAALVVLLVIVSIGVLIWTLLPEHPSDQRDAAIERQIATLRRHADHAVQTRPRVRANGCASTPGHLKAAPNAARYCGHGGLCRQRADCSDHHCPGRLAASLAGTEARRHAHH